MFSMATTEAPFSNYYYKKETKPSKKSKVPRVKIVENFPRDAARPCLMVNKLFHDVVLPIVFGHIILSLGAFELWQSPANVKRHIRKQLRALEKARTRRTLEVLKHIASDPSFAEVVKTLQIQACLGEDIEDDET